MKEWSGSQIIFRLRFLLTVTEVFFLLTLSFNIYAQNKSFKEFYVSSSGSDKNNGSINHPFATIERARDAVREDKLKSHESEYAVYLREGIYHISKTIEFDKRDSFKDNAPLIFRAYKNEVVRISGGIPIPLNKIGKVTDESVSDRFISRVKNKILQIDYSGIKIDEGEIIPHGFGRPILPAQMELFGKERAYFLARWPNAGYTRYSSVIKTGSKPCDGDYSGKGGIFVYEAKRVKRWKNAEDPWIAGYFHYGFADDAVAIKNIDTAKRQISTIQPTYYGFASGEKFNGFYGFNLLEEIDIPGEYFVDKTEKKIYFYPFDNENLSDLSLSLIKEPLIALENSSNIYFENITFECTRGMGIYIEGGSDIHFISCIFRNMGTVAICLGKGVDKNGIPASRKLGSFKEYLYSHQTWDRNCGKDQLIANCEIYNTGAGGIILGGGNRLTLEKGNNRVTNCSIHNFNRIRKTYCGAVNLDGVGNVVDHNEIYDCPSVAIHLNGNDHLIEYNIIHDAGTDGYDMGAIYYGRNPSEQGNIVRYNFFHHIGNENGNIVSIYHDDGACGMTVYGNVFYKSGNMAVEIGGGSDIHYYNNVFVEIPLAFSIDNRLQNWAQENIGANGLFRKRLNEVHYDSLPYSDAYPWLTKYWENNPGLPKRNIIENNLFCRIGQIQNGMPEWSEFDNNYFADSDPGFENMAKMNFKLRDDSKVFKVLPDFENIPFEQMGRQEWTDGNSAYANSADKLQLLLVHNKDILADNFLGVNGVYHGFAFMPEEIKRGMNDKDREREFSRIKNMGLNIARTWYRPDWACGNSLYNKFNWQSVKMRAFYKWLDEMKKLSVEVALQAGWWFTKDTYSHSPDLGDKDPNGPDPLKDPDRYALWIKESLHELLEVRGYDNIKYLILFTEPLNYNSGIIPKGFTQEEYYEIICRKINDELVKEGLRSRIKFVAPNSGSTRNGQWVGWTKNKLDDIIDIYSWHDYNATRWDREYGGWKDIVEQGKNKISGTGKPFWIDEYGCGIPDERVRTKPDYGNYIAQCVAAFTRAGAQTSFIWLLMDQLYVSPLDKADGSDAFHNGVHRWGLTKWPHDDIKNSTNPYPSWYAFSMISKYLGGRNGTKILKSTNADSLISVVAKPNGKELSVMIINTSHSSQKFEVKFDEPINLTLRRHLYNPAEVSVTEGAAIIGTDKIFKDINKSFKDKLPPRGVAVYTTMN